MEVKGIDNDLNDWPRSVSLPLYFFTNVGHVSQIMAVPLCPRPIEVRMTWGDVFVSGTIPEGDVNPILGISVTTQNDGVWTVILNRIWNHLN